MPKSKNRRKSKSNTGQGAGAQPVVEAQTVDAGAAKANKAERSGEAVRKKSVSPVEFFQQVIAEMRKVTWTTWGEVRISTLMVLIMVAIMCLFFFLIDQAPRTFMPWFLSLNLF